MNVRLRGAVLVAVLLPLTACEWFSDFKRQPSLVTWESVRSDSAIVRGSPQGSVPTTGTEVAAFAISYSPLPGTIDSIGRLLTNPTPPTPASLHNGHVYYEINCAVCHGATGAGDGPAVQFGMVPMSLLSDLAKGRSDGYIFGMIRNGRGLMPTYNRIEEPDRWDVVNYVRGLQGLLNGPVPTGALGAPGQTGETVPGASQLGPTRPVPFSLPSTGHAVPATPAAPDTAGAGGAR